MYRTTCVVGLLAALASAQGRPFNIMTTNSPGAAFASGGYGSKVTAMGDVDLDGFEDHAVVAPGAAMPLSGPNQFGVIYVVSGRTGAFIQTMLGDQLAGQFGTAMLSIGDVNGDGVPDLAVGSPSHDGAFGNAGRVEMFSGADGTRLWFSDGEALGRERGSCLAATPDLTGDGIPDLVAGEPPYSVGILGLGRVVFLNGATGAMFGECIGLNYIGAFGETACGSVSQMAVFVGDGRGRTYQVPPPVAGVSTPVLFRDKPAGSHLPPQLALIPKVGGGHRLAIGLPSANNNGNNSGVLWLHELGGLELFERPGAIAVGSFGAQLARAKDLDGDGEDEILATRGQGGLNSAVVEVVRQDGTLQDILETGCAGAPRMTSIADTTGDGRGQLVLAYSSGLCGLAEAWMFAEGLEVTATSNAAGVTATSTIDFGPGRAGETYWQWFSISGTEPGTQGPSPWPLIPLNIDGITLTADSLSGGPLAPNTMGQLDAAGRATTTLTIPAIVAPILSGIPFQTVGLVLDGSGSNVVGTTNPASWIMP